MASVRHIALFLALAIATIAVSLTPSPARAHDGHGHPAATTNTQSVDPGRTEAGRAAMASVQRELRAKCTGPCCATGAHHGSCCCATGLAPAAFAVASPPAASDRSLSREHPSPNGIVPEALPEPPRPLA